MKLERPPHLNSRDLTLATYLSDPRRHKNRLGLVEEISNVKRLSPFTYDTVCISWRQSHGYFVFGANWIYWLEINESLHRLPNLLSSMT